MSDKALPLLCGIDGCRLISGHEGEHDTCPASVFHFFKDKDQKKINKAGYATPRGGSKGAYQTHVYRNNRVIIPYERLEAVNLSSYEDGSLLSKLAF